MRDGKGEKDRVTMLPEKLIEPVRTHLERVRLLHARDLREGFGDVSLPYALARKYPRAGKEWHWQFVFPSGHRSADPEDGMIRRHHLYDSVPQRAIKEAARTAGIAKPVSCHTLRTRSRPTCSRAARTSARCRSCSDTRTCPQP